MLRLASLCVTAIALAGCAAARVPLCPQIAEASYPDSAQGKTIDYYVQKEADARNVRIKPLSSYAAELQGGYDDIDWFTKNYAYMLCAFDPRKELFDRDTYISCMSHAKQWIQIVQSEHPENLMLTQTKFLENCSSMTQLPARKEEVPTASR